MSLSRPVYFLLGEFMQQIFNYPVRTKSIAASAVAASANYTVQCLSNQKNINRKSVLAYALFGLIFGGTVPHYFYQTMEWLFHGDVKYRKLFQFISERLIYIPLYQAVSLYFLSRFEMNSHQAAIMHLEKLYWPLLKTNWQYLSLPIFFIMTYVPSMFRTIIMSLISYVWLTYVANKRQNLQDKKANSD